MNSCDIYCSFDLYESPYENDCRGMDNIDNIVSEFTNLRNDTNLRVVFHLDVSLEKR